MNLEELRTEILRLSVLLGKESELTARHDLAWDRLYQIMRDDPENIEMPWTSGWGWFELSSYSDDIRILVPSLRCASAEVIFQLWEDTIDTDLEPEYFTVNPGGYEMRINLLQGWEPYRAILYISAPLDDDDLWTLEALGKVHRTCETTTSVSIYCS